jgi:hypothetical protein
VIFTKQPMEGTFTLKQANIQSDHAPDVVMAFRWAPSNNQFGAPGMIDADWQRAAGKGTHATLSRFDMHNMLIAAGPDFKRAEADDLPSGNIDLAPTILQILGIKPPLKMDGRVLSEAMPGSTASQKPETKTIEATKRFETGTWRQSLQTSHVGSTTYLDEGNGTFVRNSGLPEPAMAQINKKERTQIDSPVLVSLRKTTPWLVCVASGADAVLLVIREQFAVSIDLVQAARRLFAGLR